MADTAYPKSNLQYYPELFSHLSERVEKLEAIINSQNFPVLNRLSQRLGWLEKRVAAQMAENIRAKNEPTSDPTLKEIIQELQQLQKDVHELHAKPINLHIDKLEIQNPRLDNLTYQLDTIDVRELSGALNIGNNLGVSVKQDGKKKEEKSSAQQTETGEKKEAKKDKTDKKR